MDLIEEDFITHPSAHFNEERLYLDSKNGERIIICGREKSAGWKMENELNEAMKYFMCVYVKHYTYI